MREAIEQKNWNEATLQTGVVIKVIDDLSNQIRQAASRLNPK
ncbi:MAG: hypothetical protein ACKOB4_05655 [Acidobacteriota bacterium]